MMSGLKSALEKHISLFCAKQPKIPDCILECKEVSSWNRPIQVYLFLNTINLPTKYIVLACHDFSEDF